MIVRPHYMELLRTYRDVPLVKILAGIRRCGKSTILEMLREDFIKNGVPADHIISMRYTSENFDEGMTDKDMYNGIKDKMTDGAVYFYPRVYLVLRRVYGVQKSKRTLAERIACRIYPHGRLSYRCAE